MSVTEAIVVSVAVGAGTLAAILGSLSPELAGLLGVAVGYGGKGIVNSSSKESSWKPGP